MPHSFAETLTLTCPACGRDFDAEAWLIVDAVERPDLLARIRTGDLHDLACPHCGDAGHMDAPLLLYQPPARAGLLTVPVLFSPAEQTTADEDQEQAMQLVDLLRETLGDDWRDDWLAEGLPGVRREHLPAVLSNDPKGAMMENAPRRRPLDQDQFLHAFEQFVNARTWNESQRIVEQQPILLHPDGDELIHQVAAAQSDPQVGQIIEEHRALLQRCREVGIKMAFSEKTGNVSDNMDIPPQFHNDLQQAKEAEQRYLRTGDRSALSTAASGWERILRHPSFPACDRRFQLAAMNDAGGVFLRRYWSVGQLPDLNRALELWQRAVNLTAEGSPDLPSILNNLANGLSDRYARTGALQDLQDAQMTYERACREGQIVQPEVAILSSRSWGNWALERRQWQEATKAYAYGRQAIDRLYAAQTSRAAKETWLKEVQGLPANAAYALAKLGRLEEAVKVLEAGRARLLAEALEHNRRDLEHLDVVGHGDLLARYRTASEQLVALQQQAGQPDAQSADRPIHQPDYTAWRQQMEQARAELNATIEAIRQVPGYEDFFLAPSFEKIQQAAAPDAPLVYLATTPAGSVALVVTAAFQKSNFSEKLDFSPAPSPVTAIWLDGLTEAALRAAIYGPADDPALGGYLGAYDRWRRSPRDAAARDAWHKALDETARWLWDTAMRPVVAHLAALGAAQAVLLPAGLLGLLPLHAAWTEDATAPTGRRYALDSIAFSYAPGARALAEAQVRAAAHAASGLLAVDNPDGSLVFSHREVAAVRSYFPPHRTTVLSGRAAAHQAVVDRSADYPVYHFSTHGWAGWNEPLQGGLLLADGTSLTLGDILDLRLEGARLAVLSACETGIPGTKMPDEVISLPTGLVQAGVAGVVASLWAVNDLSTAMLMERFYRLWREDRLTPVEALRRAQIWLRDSSNREMAAYFQADVPALAGVRMPAEVAAELYVQRMLQADGDARPFAHPFHWAAFTMTGV